MSHRRKKIINQKLPELLTITNKKYWVVLTNKNKLFYHPDGSIVIFSRRKDALEYLELHDLDHLKIDKLDIIITK